MKNTVVAIDAQHQIGVPTCAASPDPKLAINSMIRIIDETNEWRLTPDNRILVELTGIEPVASWLQTRRSPS